MTVCDHQLAFSIEPGSPYLTTCTLCGEGLTLEETQAHTLFLQVKYGLPRPRTSDDAGAGRTREGDA